MPNGWQVVPLRQVCERVRDKNSAGVDRVLSVVAGRGLVEQEKYFNRRVAAKNLSGYTVVKPGDLVYNKSYSATAPWGVVALNRGSQAGVVSPLYIVFRPSGSSVDGQFLELAATSVTTTHSLAGLVKEGGRAHGGINISLDDFFSVLLPLPSIDEQRRIVDLVASIDSCIDRLQTQAEATRAARSALLAELLSNPGNDWQVTTLGEVADYQNGFPFKPEHLAGSALPVIRIRQLLDEAEAPDRTDIAVSERHRIDDGDIIFSWSATLAVRIWNRGPAALNQHLFKVLAKPQVEPAWLALALDDAIRDLTGKAHGTTMKHITKSALSAHAISLPPRKEQLRIADLVGSFDKQIASLDSQIDSAQSFCAGVLSELLSGERLLDESYDVAVSL